MNFGSSGGGLTRSEASAEWPAAFRPRRVKRAGAPDGSKDRRGLEGLLPRNAAALTNAAPLASSAVWGRSFLFEHRLRAGPDSNRSRQRSDLFGSSGLPGTTLTLPGRRLTIG